MKRKKKRKETNSQKLNNRGSPDHKQTLLKRHQHTLNKSRHIDAKGERNIYINWWKENFNDDNMKVKLLSFRQI